MSKFEDMWDQEQAAGAERRAARPLSFYGRIDLAGRYVVLQKGYPGGKRDFDPTLDPEDARRMSVRVLIEPIDPSAARPFEREFLAYSAEGDLFRDALTGIGTTLKDLHDTKPYVRVDVVEDPRLGTFPDRTTGATRTRSTGLVREVFPSEDACRAAAEARYGGRERTIAGMPWSPPAPATAPSPLEAPRHRQRPRAGEQAGRRDRPGDGGQVLPRHLAAGRRRRREVPGRDGHEQGHGHALQAGPGGARGAGLPDEDGPPGVRGRGGGQGRRG